MNVSLGIAVPVIATTVLATISDLRRRRIPNLLTGVALLLGVAVQVHQLGAAGVLVAGAGMLLAGGLLFPGWLMGFMGAGDVKLMAAIGAWLGPGLALMATLFALIAGGVMAVIVAARKGVLVSALYNTAALAGWLVASRGGSARPHVATGDPSISATPVPSTGVRFPFALAIGAGALLAMVIKT